MHFPGCLSLPIRAKVSHVYRPLSAVNTSKMIVRRWLAVLRTVTFWLAVAGCNLSSTRQLTLFLSDVPRQMQALNMRDWRWARRMFILILDLSKTGTLGLDFLVLL